MAEEFTVGGHMVQHKPITTAALASVALTVFTLVGCGTTVGLQETTPVRIAASPPAAPPPPPPPPVVEVEQTRIRVDEKIHFEIDSDAISSVSDGLIQEIARVINANPQVRKIRVEGHTDSQGSAPYNLDLSKRRARSVVAALTRYGVDAGRLQPEGFGLTRPIADNATNEGRARNRRVEFNILERDDSLTNEADGAGAQTAPEGGAR
ncbi:MAG: OmpA family protein [Polyangiaceae bacterium]|nr:OmpA family protein [Polyangiaceae bacterium]